MSATVSKYLIRVLLLTTEIDGGLTPQQHYANVVQMATNVQRFAGRRAHSIRDAHLLIGQATVAGRLYS